MHSLQNLTRHSGKKLTDRAKLAWKEWDMHVGEDQKVLLLSDIDFGSCAALRALEQARVAEETTFYCAPADLATIAGSGSFSSAKIAILDFEYLTDSPNEVVELVKGHCGSRCAAVALVPESRLLSLLPELTSAQVDSVILKPEATEELREAMLQLKLYWLLLDRR